MRSAMTKHDLANLNILIGRAMLDHQMQDALIKTESRHEVLVSVPLTLGATEYLNSLASAPDLNTFAMWILAGIYGPTPI